MKFSTVLLFAIGAFALPQDVSVTSAPTSAIPIPSGLTPPVSCALACTAGDVTCQAACLGNARPNASQVVETNECAAKCDQGDGSTEASDAFAECQANCINSYFPSSQTAFAAAGAAVASSAASAAASVTNPANPTGTSGSSATGSESGSAASPQSTGAADKTSARLAGAGLAGLLAIFAL